MASDAGRAMYPHLAAKEQVEVQRPIASGEAIVGENNRPYVATTTKGSRQVRWRN